jgi:EEF1A lysine methyltransferase 1
VIVNRWLIHAENIRAHHFQESPLRSNSKVLDIDKQWENDPAFVFYDFHDPAGVPSELHSHFDGIVVDPPFITADVWKKYARTAKLLLKKGGKIICTTIAENAGMMQELLDLKLAPFKPCIPNLVYQYNLYLNFEPEILREANAEVLE